MMEKAMKRLISALVVLLVVLSSRPAPADETQVTPSIAARAAYNDNIFFDRANEMDDYVFTFTPGLSLTRRTELLDSLLRVDVPIIRYADHDELDAVDQRYSGNLRYQWSPRFATSFHAGYIRDSQPGRELLETGIVFDDVTRRRLSAGLSGEYYMSEVTSAGLAYAYGDEKYKDQRFTDIESHSLNLTFTRNMEKTFANTHGRLTFGGSRYEFTRSTVENYSAMVGAVRRLTELYSISADVGLRYTRSEFEVLRLQPLVPALLQVAPIPFRIVTEKEKSDDVGAVGRAALSYQGETTRASLSFFRDIATSGGRAGTVERTAIVFDVGKRFTYRLWGHFSAGYYLNESKGREFALREIDEETWRLNPYFRYNYTLNLSFEASYSYAKVNYGVDNTDADRNLVFLRLVYHHPLLN
jgi:hypothetical protein